MLLFCFAGMEQERLGVGREMGTKTLKILRPIFEKEVENVPVLHLFFFRILFILCLDRREGREKDRERNINVWLPLAHSLLRAWPTTQACALTGNRTSYPFVHRLVFNPLSHTGQGCIYFY